MNTAPGAVLDTNVLLDLWLFDDPRVRGLRQAIESRRLRPLRSAACDLEFAEVLRRERFGLRTPGCESILAHWERCSDPILAVQPAPLNCADRDDQKFLDAAFSAGARWLLTRDKSLLALARRAEAAGLRIRSPERAMTYDR